ncbi:galactokinase [Paenibacillus hemerocallicola]|uniref:Galactokinase n=1 Tax=Paenibacillus hemerocallicola TaxID=1172614 RepID=A0A5C4TFN5_9BACL|nr:galactokinase [Paenibacillus hemerocallicola]TNJ67446.1 galactokinase [Paenibacillus hemerocallicola]
MTLTTIDIRELRRSFAERFGDADGVRCFFAPGRVNLIGEHTDYNGGYVFPAALTFGTYALVKPRNDGVYRFRSLQFAAEADVAVSDVTYRKEDDWANYPKGVLAELLKLEDGAYAPKMNGADLLYFGDVPNGAGLSSSASIELATALALSSLAQIDVPMLELVKLSQRAENRFVGVNCGIMDQFAVGMGKRDHAVMLKCDTLDYQYVPFRIDGCKLVITNTNKRRGLADSKYNERRQQCEDGLKWLKEKLPGLGSLGELSLGQWEQLKSAIPDPLIRSRAEHVVTEDDRVLKARASLEQGDLVTFGKLMNASHESLRDLYEVTGFELDTLYEEASAVEGCVGTRMTGAGFGGCNVSIVRNEAVDEFQRAVAERYTAKTGLVPSFYVCEIGDGAKELEV